ncbi:MAG: dTDP-4-dehydrorhamnose reductase [Terrimicrobiaceae bacterium]|nr:dTDP-4-dehydrorhamnose reductase [Terrimicrobiaceae bacterium]
MKIAILGARGRLGAALVRKWGSRPKKRGEKAPHTVRAFARPELDLLDPKTIDRCLGKKEPFDWVVNCAAQTNVDACERQPEQARLVNTVAARHIAERCARTGARFIHISTDYVFDGRQRVPYDEEAAPSPLSVYGQSKADGEFGVLAALPEAIVARVSWVFGPEKASFIDMLISRALGHAKVAAIANKWSTPTYTEDLADWLGALVAADAPGGVYHLCNAGGCSWREYGEHALHCAADQGLPVKTKTVAPLEIEELEGFVAERPVYTVMSTARFTNLTKIAPRPWEDAVRDYVRDYPPY